MELSHSFRHWCFVIRHFSCVLFSVVDHFAPNHFAIPFAPLRLCVFALKIACPPAKRFKNTSASSVSIYDGFPWVYC